MPSNASAVAPLIGWPLGGGTSPAPQPLTIIPATSAPPRCGRTQADIGPSSRTRTGVRRSSEPPSIALLLPPVGSVPWLVNLGAARALPLGEVVALLEEALGDVGAEAVDHQAFDDRLDPVAVGLRAVHEADPHAGVLLVVV